MSQQTMSRRKFLKTTGIVLGSTVLAGSGVALVDALQPAEEVAQPPISMPDTTFGGSNMSKRILVTYASQGGSTAGIAEAIAKSLAEGGAQVDVRPVKAVEDLTPYHSVVIGSAVHSGTWMPEALELVERNRETLRRIPTAVFQVCMMLATDNQQYKSMVPSWLDPIREKIKPASTQSFAGALYPDRYPKLTDRLGLRIFLAAIKKKAGDYRDWSAIRAWAESLRPMLG